MGLKDSASTEPSTLTQPVIILSLSYMARGSENQHQVPSLVSVIGSVFSMSQLERKMIVSNSRNMFFINKRYFNVISESTGNKTKDKNNNHQCFKNSKDEDDVRPSDLLVFYGKYIAEMCGPDQIEDVTIDFFIFFGSWFHDVQSELIRYKEI